MSEEITKLNQTFGDQGIRFAGPDLLDYKMIFKIAGGEYDGESMSIDSSYHPCCGTLEVNASLKKKYKRWQNMLDGCKLHRRKGGGDRTIKQIIYDLGV
jgi:hypothetical protein